MTEIEQAHLPLAEAEMNVNDLLLRKGWEIEQADQHTRGGGGKERERMLDETQVSKIRGDEED